MDEVSGGTSWRSVALTHDQIVDDDRPQVLQRASGLTEKFDEWRFSASEKLERVDLTPDLAESIGSKRWFRGLGTLLGLSAIALAMWPDFSPLEAAPVMEVDDSVRDEFRSQMIMPLALGADSGRHMGATPTVVELESAPERPQLDMLATLARGDSFGRMLQRAGVGSRDADRVSELIGRTMPLGEIEPGTQVDITLGRRPAPGETRPLDNLSFRARFDLALQIERVDGNLALKRIPIRVDDTPLRIRGTVGGSLYRSARAAGAPASAVQQYLSALGDQIDLDRAVRSTDTFDIIVSHRRAATGERQAGKLLYAGIDRSGKPKTQLMRWGDDGRFYEASGVGEQRSGLVAPVPGPISSRYGMRRHPILGYRRMHAGLDFRARSGTPIVAVTDGRVVGAGRMGGCGKAVRLNHAGNLATRYCHMSRIAVRNGQSVRRGQIIGYVGSTGLSTGPHLHYEMYRGGRSVNPASVRFVTRAQLSGDDLRKFRAALAKLKTVEEGAALADLEQKPSEMGEPEREIDKLEASKKVS
ncbi:peptidoglycan DD-metalloendopeptidase family protein [Altererythrobacter aestiaquae]|uniref:Peptidoglycan DD-metalloendopeptidase family protein n=1 Tax=Pontixanthobacter aestiaquae TaxID=1509367 RepID=A0A844Z430_9SPHN|nr:peptidoglycan DD-metalloendopeptidase family protein [Pontixanthobacter aestiaquae]